MEMAFVALVLLLGVGFVVWAVGWRLVHALIDLDVGD
jgi:hypothetical protein